ncbi:MAG: hypothetical protein KatS3mg115_2478 [Candidatus Poribacteria bacterium]|nr:MAG: hypothetical protein KatS3mg115_2478 [Candidatus Poribacteria bacterium]
MQLFSVVGKTEVQFIVRHAVLHTEGRVLARRLREAVLEARPRRIVLDLRGVRLMDSFGIYALADFCKWLHREGRDVELIVLMNRPLERLFRMAHLEPLFTPQSAPGEEEVVWQMGSSERMPLLEAPLSPRVGEGNWTAVAC